MKIWLKLTLFVCFRNDYHFLFLLQNFPWLGNMLILKVFFWIHYSSRRLGFIVIMIIVAIIAIITVLIKIKTFRFLLQSLNRPNQSKFHQGPQIWKIAYISATQYFPSEIFLTPLKEQKITALLFNFVTIFYLISHNCSEINYLYTKYIAT